MQAQTYSLRTILDSDLDPILCKLMLHEIKSPLLEHSFQLTADEDPGSFILNNGSPNKTNPHSNNLQNLSVTNSYYQNSHTDNKNEDKHLTHRKSAVEAKKSMVPTNYKKDGKFTESIVSPLQHYSSLESNNTKKVPSNKNDESRNEEYHIYFRDNREEPGSGNEGGVSEWCGKVFTPDLDAGEFSQLTNSNNPYHFHYQNKSRQFNRRKIFKNSTRAPLTVSFPQAIQRLNKIQEFQVSNFIGFLSKLLQNFTKIVPYKRNLRFNHENLRKMFLSYSPVDYQTKETISNNNRILNRLGVVRMSQAFEQILAQKQASNSNKESELMETDIEKTLLTLSSIEDIIEDYVSREESVIEIEAICGLLCGEEKRNSGSNTPISNLKITEQAECGDARGESLLQNMNRLLYSLKIDESFFFNLIELKYIWPHISEPGYYKANKEQFINELCKNDILVKNSNKYDWKLHKMGYMRNQ